MQMLIHCVTAVAFVFFVSLGSRLDAAAGTSSVATIGSPAYVSPSWPDGVGQLVNDSTRTDGWNDWFSEWPNDVNHYCYQITGMADLNRLVRGLASTKGELRQIRLAPLKEPRGLGWVTSLPKGNDTPVVFSIGDQKRLDEWFGRLRNGKFGVMQFEATPVAVPPTLTIFVQNEAIDLGQLEIPDGIAVTAGYCPRPFHKWNTIREKERKKQRANEPEANAKPVDDATQDAVDQINEFLERLAQRVKQNEKKQ